MKIRNFNPNFPGLVIREMGAGCGDSNDIDRLEWKKTLEAESEGSESDRDI